MLQNKTLIIYIILKESMVHVSDNCRVLKVKCFHIYGNKKKKWGCIKKFIKSSNRMVAKRRYWARGAKARGFFYKSKYRFIKPDGCSIRFQHNMCVLLKKRLYPKGKVTRGCVLYNVKRRKFIFSFAKCL